MVALADWLVPVVRDVLVVLQKTTVTQIETVVDIASQMAYAQISAYVNRPLINDTYIEYYAQVGSILKLRTLPIDSITSIYTGHLLDTLIESSYYTLIGSKEIRFSIGVTGFAYGYEPGDMEDIEMKVTYIAGTDLSDDVGSKQYHDALVLQTIGIWNSKDVLGVLSVFMGPHGNIVKIPNTAVKGGDELVPQARSIIEPYVYYGQAEDML